MNDLAVQEQRTTAITPMQLLQLALQKESNVDVIAKLKAMQDEERDYQARVNFTEAFFSFKASVPKIVKTASIKVKEEVRGKYAPLFEICEKLIPALIAVGITHRWKSVTEANGRTTVTCFLRHRTGYEEEGSSMTAAPDQTGSKNAIQADGSTVSYLERYTFVASCGIAIQNDDTDGNTTVDPAWVDAKLEEIRGAATKDTLRDVYMGAAKEAATAKDKGAVRAIAEAKDAKQRDLEEAEELEGRENAKALFEQHSNLHGFNKYIVPQMKTMPHWFKTMAAVEAVNRGYVADKSTGSYAEGR